MTRSRKRRLARARLAGLPPAPVGFHPLRSGRPYWSGILPSFKAPANSLRGFFFTTWLEFELALWMELHPNILQYQRLDVHAAAAASLGLEPLPGLSLCHALDYWWEKPDAENDGSTPAGTLRHVLPDIGALWDDLTIVIAQAGRPERKATPEARRALEAQREYALARHGRFVLHLEGLLPPRYIVRGLALHLWRFAYAGPAELLAEIERAWVESRSARSLMKQFAARASAEIVRHAVMKVAGDALARGRLDHNLLRADFYLDTMTRIRGEGEALVLPPPLRDDVPAELEPDSDEDELPLHIDLDALPPAAAEELHRLRAIMQAIEAGEPAAHYAAELGRGERAVQLLAQKWQRTHDDELLLKRLRWRDGQGKPVVALRERESEINRDVKRFIVGALRRNHKLTARELYDSPELATRCGELGLGVPSLPALRRFRGSPELFRQVPAAAVHPSRRGRPSTAEAAGFTEIFGGRPGLYLQYDEEITNLMHQVLPRVDAASRPHRMKAKDVGTKAPASQVLSCRTMDAGDLRRLFVRTTRPKNDLAKASGCEHDWPIACLPMIWCGDNAWINSAHMFVKVLPRYGVMLLFAPAKRPDTKGDIESDLSRDQKLMEDDFANSTKRSPAERGDAKPEDWAIDHGIGLPEIERHFVYGQVEEILHGAPRRREDPVPMHAWGRGEAKYGVRTLEEPLRTALLRELKRPIRKTLTVDDSLRVSYGDRYYVSRWAGGRDDDPRNDLPYPTKRRGIVYVGQAVRARVDDDDVRMLDVYDADSARFLGTLVSNKLGLRYGRPVSQFEVDLDLAAEASAHKAGRDNRARAVATMKARDQSRERKALARDQARAIHLQQRRLEAMSGSLRRHPRRSKPSPDVPEPTPWVPAAERYATPQIHLLAEDPDAESAA